MVDNELRIYNLWKKMEGRFFTSVYIGIFIFLLC